LPPIEPVGPLVPGEEIPTLEEIRTGDIKVEVIDARDFFTEQGAESLTDARWCCVRRTAPVSDIRNMFPEMAPFIKVEEGVNFTSQAELRYYAIDSYSDFEQLHDHAFLYEFHEKPTEQYTKGRIIWVCNNIVLREIESPYYELGRFPFFHLGWDKNPGEFWYEPFLTQAWHRQRELNNNETAIREHVELLLKPKLLNPLGSRVTADEFTATTAQVIAYNPAAGQIPKFLQHPPVPADMWRRGEQLALDIRQQATVTDADMGLSQTDPNGRALAIISAEADQQLGPIRRRNNDEFKELYRGILVLAQKYYHSDRLWTVIGPDGVEVHYYQDMNLTDGWDVQLEEHDGMSTNPAIRLQQTMDLANLGYFIDSTTGGFDKKAFARAAKLHVPDKGYDIEATERAAAAQIPKKVERGEPVIPRTFDDPHIFAEVLLGWLRGPGRRSDPAISMMVEQIWQFYVMWALTGQMGQMPGQMGMGMGPEGGAGPGGPDQTAPGGTPNNVGHLPSGTVAQDARAMTQQADITGERAAQTQASGR
jgi:hypothetical protein